MLASQACTIPHLITQDPETFLPTFCTLTKPPDRCLTALASQAYTIPHLITQDPHTSPPVSCPLAKFSSDNSHKMFFTSLATSEQVLNFLRKVHALIQNPTAETANYLRINGSALLYVRSFEKSLLKACERANTKSIAAEKRSKEAARRTQEAWYLVDRTDSAQEGQSRYIKSICEDLQVLATTRVSPAPNKTWRLQVVSLMHSLSEAANELLNIRNELDLATRDAEVLGWKLVRAEERRENSEEKALALREEYRIIHTEAQLVGSLLKATVNELCAIEEAEEARVERIEDEEALERDVERGCRRLPPPFSAADAADSS